MADILVVRDRHPHVRGLARLSKVLSLVDPGAESPKETWLRLVLVGGGFPRPKTQVPVQGQDGRIIYYLDMGWPDLMLAVEYDGQQHRLDDRQYKSDLRRSEYLSSLGWTVVRVVAGDRKDDILRRVAAVFPRQ